MCIISSKLLINNEIYKGNQNYVLGWNFAKITDVVVHRVHDGKALTSPKDTAELVMLP